VITLTNNFSIILRCWNTDDISCGDIPIFVIVDNQGLTHDVIHNKDIRSDNDIHLFEYCKYNGVPVYDITVSEKEYTERFGELAKQKTNEKRRCKNL
jgi:hypothetical protein